MTGPGIWLYGHTGFPGARFYWMRKPDNLGADSRLVG